jgi:hypothetical protein
MRPLSSFIILNSTLILGCAVGSPPPRPAVATPIEAAQRADAYCKQQGINWGQSHFIYPQRGGYYVEYIQQGDARVHHGLTVNADGSVEP